LAFEGQRLWQGDRNAGFLAGQDLRAVEVASIRDDIEALPPQRVFGLLGHAGE
jgi:hypothetical protein